jgi:hypothetical protein
LLRILRLMTFPQSLFLECVIEGPGCGKCKRRNVTLRAGYRHCER